MAVAFGTVNVRSGPGIEFESIAELEFQFERPIVGRAATAAWWQILLSAGQLGWVSDLGITVIGYTGAVPITATGANDGQQPEWNPTPNPLCTPPSQEEIVISDGQLEALRLAESATPASDDVQPRKPSPAAANNDQQSSALSPQLDDNATEFNLIWLLVAGGILIATGSIALLLQRRQA